MSCIERFKTNREVSINDLIIRNVPDDKKESTQLSYIFASGEQGCRTYTDVEEWIRDYEELCAIGKSHYKEVIVGDISIKASTHISRTFEPGDFMGNWSWYTVSYEGRTHLTWFAEHKIPFDNVEMANEAFNQIYRFAKAELNGDLNCKFDGPVFTEGAYGLVL